MGDGYIGTIYLSISSYPQRFRKVSWPVAVVSNGLDGCDELPLMVQIDNSFPLNFYKKRKLQ